MQLESCLVLPALVALISYKDEFFRLKDYRGISRVGKYTDIKSKPGNDTQWLLQIIANELAEANRLKRIEIRSMFVIENGHIEKNVIKYGLDDSNDFAETLKDRA